MAFVSANPVARSGAQDQAAQACKDWQACRQLALEAADRKDYDAFHDLAWRALQAGPKNSPELMTLVARAQSLSGRPHDALVMLQRLAAMGIRTDAETSEDFARVRALPGWAEIEAKTSGIAAPPVTSAPSSSAGTSKPSPAPKTEAPVVTSKPATEKPRAEKPAPEKPPAEKPGADNPPAAPPAATPPAGTTTAAAKTTAKTPAEPRRLMFPVAGMSAVGLGYDAVSGRFLVGDRQERKLLVLGERSGRLASLAGTDAGFNEVTAFEIDTREGDLWVVSTSSQSRTSTLHKLQLISGRVLTSMALPEDLGPSRFTDVAVTTQGILILDSEGRRVLRAAKKGKVLDVAAHLAVPDASSLASATETTAYAAFDRGLLRIDLPARALSVVEANDRIDLSGFAWIRYHRGSLVGIQKAGDGTLRLLRIRLDDTGRIARGVDVLDQSVALGGPTTATISGNTLYYLGKADGKDEFEIKRLVLK